MLYIYIYNIDQSLRAHSHLEALRAPDSDHDIIFLKRGFYYRKYNNNQLSKDICFLKRGFYYSFLLLPNSDHDIISGDTRFSDRIYVFRRRYFSGSHMFRIRTKHRAEIFGEANWVHDICS